MSEALNFFEIYENAIYFFLGLGAIIYGWRFWGAWQRLRNAVFGLEREVAQRDVNQAAVVLFLLLMMSVAVFSVVTFSAPFLQVEEILATPTIDLLPESTVNAVDGDTGSDSDEIATVTPLPTVVVNPGYCIPDRINITSPETDEVISGVINVEGTVDVEDFGFFQVEYARVQDSLWLPIRVKHNIIINGLLVEDWDTSPIPPGDYVLQLLVTSSDGVEYDACRVPIRIEPGGE
jgi:hypothetical protein